ncbi:MAG TPA: glycoside hydrolase family 44 protein, partial [Candidatus Acidoferrum sp.]|nr:glycoside hydrolase family 44 protein [Candidatus Acidoferrum sp.]
MTQNHEAPRSLHNRAHLRGNPLLASHRRATAVRSHRYLKAGGWGANHELFHQLVLILLVCLFVFEIVGCAGGVKSGTTTTGTGSGSTSGGNGSGNSGGSGTTTTIPAVPTGVNATAGNAQVAIAWTASSGATGYHVKRGTASGGPFTQVSAPTTTSFTDTSVTNGTTYFYVVSALNSAGESANSTAVSAKPTAPTQPQSQIPPTPTSLVATAGNAQISLTWAISSGATSYHVKRSTTTGGPYTQISAPTTNTYLNTSLANGTKYFYVVSALNASGESANSAEANATPTAPPANQTPDVTITIDPTHTKPISPYIYGLNFYFGETDPPPMATLDRDGGNRWTAYNWETNASNAGSDFLYENDSYLSSSTVPAEAVRGFIAQDQNNGLASLVTVQMQGLVSADESGPVSTSNPPDMSRFKTVVDKKSTVSATAFTIAPPTSDANVYMDEFVWALNQKLPGIFAAGATHPTFINLDNEPELWNSTHLEIQGPNPVTSDNYITKTINLTKAIKDQFPNAIIFGPVHYGFEGIYSWQGELNPTPNGTNWFPDKYLTALKSASTTYGHPLVDVYDFHWYAEDYDSNGTRILDLTGTTLTDAQIQLIVQSPRNFWDPTFNDQAAGNSNPWIYQSLGNTPINILGRLQAKINAENPGMKLSVSEYESGGWNHIAGTVSQADNLGIFGAQGVFAASFWPPNGTYSYALAGFRAFRDFDGANSVFGDTSLQSTSSNVANVVVYASTDTTTPGRTVFVAINRSKSAQVVAINGASLTGTAHLYQMT